MRFSVEEPKARRIYVAGASAELDRVRAVTRALVMSGLYALTYDWTKDVAEFGSAGKALPDEKRKAFAWSDIHGVLIADVFWLLVPEPPAKSVGCWIELGAAIAGVDASDHDRPLIVISGETDSIFALQAYRRFERHDQALAWLLRGDLTQ